MVTKSIKQTVQDLFNIADIKINGERPWDIKVHNKDFYARVLARGSLAFGETYMDGWWDCEALDQLIYRIIKAHLHTKIKATRQFIWNLIKAKIINQQRKSKAYIVGERHYDIGNDLFKYMLDKRMNYSCGYWKNAKNLNDAQEAKLDLICRKQKLGIGMRVLDIGCGWGSFAKYAADKFHARVVGITISKEQINLSRELCKGLDIEIKLMDYRDLNEKYDRIVSVGMFEHVGYKNYRRFFKVVHRCLKNDGLFLLHTIGRNKSVTYMDPWIDKYIFPHSMVPSASQITKAYEGIFKLEDWHNFGMDYDKTLRVWHKNFNKNWDKIKVDYNDRFRRMWNYYLLSCAGSFRVRNTQLWQIVFSKIESQADYESIR